MTFIAKALVALMACVLVTGVGAQSSAASYPNRPIRIVLGYAPGGANDFLMRLVAARMQESWNQPVVVENRPGGNSIIALEAVAKAPADGYTLLLNGTGGMSINPSMYAKLPYDSINSFVAFGPLIATQLVLAVQPSVPVNTLPEFLAWARANDKNLNYASAATSSQIAAEMFLQRTGIRATHIPFKGGAEVAQAVMGGTVQMTFFDSVSIAPFLKSGQIKGIAVTSAKRVASLPDLPTVAEAGVPGYEMILWLAMFAPAGTPPDIMAKLNAEAHRIFALPEVRERLASMGAEPEPATAESVANRIRDDIDRYKAVVKSSGMTVQ